MSNAILVSGYFGGDGHDRKLAYMECLHAALSARSARLVLYDLSPDRVSTPLTVIKANYGQTLAKHLPGWLTPTMPENDAALRRAAECEAAIWNCSSERGLARVDQFVRDFGRVLHTLRPDRVVLWHQFNGLHYTARAICDAAAIPVVFAEYGELPGTIAFSETGQMGLSLPAQDPLAFARRPVAPATAEAVARYIDRMAAERRTRKPQENAGATRAALDALKSKGYPIVFYAGQNDRQAGLMPAWHPEARIHSPYYESTIDLLEHLAQLAEDRGWSLVFKPHPHLAETHARAAAAFPNVTIVERGDIFECIDAANAVVTLVSQVAYLALIRSKPTVVLGRIGLTESGCVYEVESRDAVSVELQTALDHGLTPVHLAARNRHFAQLLEHSLYTMDPDLENLLGRTPRDAAEHLLQSTLGIEPRFDAIPASTERAIQTQLIAALGILVSPLRTLYKRR